ncbi:hypothetical protein Nepgr_030098 [Nepenthes gracilis]|uniref:Uncharacterized protein n=1 Tax=Nepenthes gracilis TaxID=150966 RepID=A0AAD3TER7_NEPGR|nr:hypothetical protein Nepgr_030098 [Nepenthes gracilis]
MLMILQPTTTALALEEDAAVMRNNMKPETSALDTGSQYRLKANLLQHNTARLTNPRNQRISQQPHNTLNHPLQHQPQCTNPRSLHLGSVSAISTLHIERHMMIHATLARKSRKIHPLRGEKQQNSYHALVIRSLASTKKANESPSHKRQQQHKVGPKSDERSKTRASEAKEGDPSQKIPHQ